MTLITQKWVAEQGVYRTMKEELFLQGENANKSLAFYNTF